MSVMRVAVYLNLHKSKPSAPCYSIRSMESGRVIAWKTCVSLTRVIFKVNAKTRDRVRATRRKEIHALVIGDLVEDEGSLPEGACLKKVRYNPYLTDTFVLADTGGAIHSADRALLDANGVFVFNPVDRDSGPT